MATMSLNKEELTLVKILLEREAAETRLELHHSRHNMEFRNALTNREKEISNVLAKVQEKLAAAG